MSSRIRFKHTPSYPPKYRIADMTEGQTFMREEIPSSGDHRQGDVYIVISNPWTYLSNTRCTRSGQPVMCFNLRSGRVAACTPEREAIPVEVEATVTRL